MADFFKSITLPNGKKYDVKDETARNDLANKVPTSRTINNKALTSNITLTASDVSAYSKTETNTAINNAINISDADVAEITGYLG